MINFINSVGAVVAKIDHTARTVHTVMTRIDLIKEALSQCTSGSPLQRYNASNMVEVVRKYNYRVNQVDNLPEDKLPSECHIG